MSIRWEESYQKTIVFPLSIRYLYHACDYTYVVTVYSKLECDWDFTNHDTAKVEFYRQDESQSAENQWKCTRDYQKFGTTFKDNVSNGRTYRVRWNSPFFEQV